MALVLLPLLARFVDQLQFFDAPVFSMGPEPISLCPCPQCAALDIFFSRQIRKSHLMTFLTKEAVQRAHYLIISAALLWHA